MSEIRTYVYSTPGQLDLFEALIMDGDKVSKRCYVAPDIEVAFTMAMDRLRKGQQLIRVSEEMPIDSVCFEITEYLAEHDRRSA